MRRPTVWPTQKQELLIQMNKDGGVEVAKKKMRIKHVFKSPTLGKSGTCRGPGRIQSPSACG